MSTHYQRYIRYVLIAVLCVAAMPARTQAAVIGKPANHIGLVSGLIGHWTFDGPDMRPNVRDRSGQGNHGNLSGQTSTTTTFGKIGQALQFDGVNDVVAIPDNDAFDGLSAISWSFWVHDTTASNYADFFTKGGESSGLSSVWAFMQYDALDRIRARLVSATSTFFEIYIDYGDIKGWKYITLTLDGSAYRAYLNGEFLFSGSMTGSLNSTSDRITLGGNTFGADSWNGRLDDVRVYNRALSTSEIKQLYAMGVTKLGLSTPAASSLSSGLVGHWTFDGKDMSPNVRDISGQGNHGNLIGQTSTTTTFGKIGQALQFDGVNDYVRTGAIQTPSFTGTISMWVSRSSATNVNYLFDARGSSSGGTGYGYILANYGESVATNDGTIYINGILQSPSNRISNDSWYHVVISGITLDINQDFKIGSRLGGSETPWWGKIDDVRIYNRALSASEIKQLYAMGATKLGLSTPAASSLSSGLVGHWTFDGKDMSPNVRDISGQGNHGNLIGQTATTTTFGKLGQALSFDGYDDVVSVADTGTPLSSLTFSFWNFQRSAPGNNAYQFYLGVNEDFVGNELARFGNSGAFRFQASDTAGNGVNSLTFPSDYVNKWKFYTVMITPTSYQIYIDGVLFDTQVPVSGTFRTYDSFKIGSSGQAVGQTIDGSLDDVRVYNRALSASEVQQLYNMGR